MLCLTCRRCLVTTAAFAPVAQLTHHTSTPLQVGLRPPLYGPLVTLNDKDAEKCSQATIAEVNKGRALFNSIVQTISLTEAVRSEGDKVFQRLNRYIRHGNGARFTQELNNRVLGGKGVTEDERDRLLAALLAEHDPSPQSPGRACILGTRHAQLDEYDRILSRLFAIFHGRREYRMPSDDVVVETSNRSRRGYNPYVKLSGTKDGSPVKGWLADLVAAHPTLFTANKTGKIAKNLSFVKGAVYRLWDNPQYLADLGACNGCLATAVGFIPHADEPAEPSDLGNDAPCQLEKTPVCLLLRLHDTKLLRGKCIGGLPFGVVPWFPTSATFKVDIGAIDKPWVDTQRRLGRSISDYYKIKRTGFKLKVRWQQRIRES